MEPAAVSDVFANWEAANNWIPTVMETGGAVQLLARP
jgi:hypothetical protein